MCVMNHTLFIVDSSGFLRAYVPSHLIKDKSNASEASLKRARSEDMVIESTEEAATSNNVGSGCVWNRHTKQGKQAVAAPKTLFDMVGRFETG